MQIITYPHPTLRRKSKPLKRINSDLRRIAAEMIELMYESKGVGLAANQVDMPIRMFVVNSTGDPEQPQFEQVYVNPVLSKRKGLEEAEEGCLSLPGVFGQVKRPERVTVSAFDLSGNAVEGEIGGLLARVVQHETDHLDGILFTDRLSETGLLAIKQALDEFEVNYEGSRSRGDVPDDEALARHWARWEEQYC